MPALELEVVKKNARITNARAYYVSTYEQDIKTYFARFYLIRAYKKHYRQDQSSLLTGHGIGVVI